MPLQIQDYLVTFAASGARDPVVGTIVASPDAVPIWEKDANTNQFYEVQPPYTRSAQSRSSDGQYTLYLPWPSETDPSTAQWTVKLPDGYAWKGAVPEGVVGPVTLKTLKDSYGWQRVT